MGSNVTEDNAARKMRSAERIVGQFETEARVVELGSYDTETGITFSARFSTRDKLNGSIGKR